MSRTTRRIDARCNPQAAPPGPAPARSAAVPDATQPLRQLIAANIRAERSRHEITQEQLASHLGAGWSRDMVSNIERGRRPVAYDELPGLCRALDCTAVHLLRGAARADLAALGLS
jgi:DNA-binding XRE family transcriptional regulator